MVTTVPGQGDGCNQRVPPNSGSSRPSPLAGVAEKECCTCPGLCRVGGKVGCVPGESQGRGSLMGCRLWGHTESDTTEAA